MKIVELRLVFLWLMDTLSLSSLYRGETLFANPPGERVSAYANSQTELAILRYTISFICVYVYVYVCVRRYYPRFNYNLRNPFLSETMQHAFSLFNAAVAFNCRPEVCRSKISGTVRMRNCVRICFFGEIFDELFFITRIYQIEVIRF